MSKYTLLFFNYLVLLFHFCSSDLSDFCKIDCAAGGTSFIHTVCKRKYECGVESDCQEIQSNYEFREYILRSHNELRNLVANGSNIKKYNHFKNTGAKNMNALNYDLELEYIARCWVNTCVRSDHDECRDVDRFYVGQNIYWGQRSDIIRTMTQTSVTAWFDEIKFITDEDWIRKYPGKSGDNPFPIDGNKRGHVTQLMWADTKYLGCSRVRFKKNDRQGTLICNYGPSGNMIGLPIYKLAENEHDIASECEVKNEDFPALCGEIEPVPDAEYTAVSSITDDAGIQGSRNKMSSDDGLLDYGPMEPLEPENLPDQSSHKDSSHTGLDDMNGGVTLPTREATSHRSSGNVKIHSIFSITHLSVMCSIFQVIDLENINV
ncbi:hypothetical protein HHI36_001510 [Cryptolaemus montrouzieri]|uniref:SCP domain-containing protein n=1 Tax=Cryptolaemus montrouzieri TaxID=559131 RepID=A0ABD2P7W0_9CUCU